MKTRYWAIFNLRRQDIERHGDRALVYRNKGQAEYDLNELGRYAPDNNILRKVIPIYLTHYDNPQIFELLD